MQINETEVIEPFVAGHSIERRNFIHLISSLGLDSHHRRIFRGPQRTRPLGIPSPLISKLSL